MSELSDEIFECVNSVVDDENLTLKIVRRLLKDFGGMQVYFPQERNVFKEADQRDVYEEFNGSNLREVCRKYGISTSTVYKMVNSEKAKRQNRAFGGLERKI